MMFVVFILPGQVFFRVFFKGAFTARGTKIIRFTVIFRCPFCGFDFDFHFSDVINSDQGGSP